jgi:CxxC motif-containing protein (DUF1111 family)
LTTGFSPIESLSFKEFHPYSDLLLHDGRASSIEEAIELHGGEADNSKAQYLSLTPKEKSQLIKFINSL